MASLKLINFMDMARFITMLVNIKDNSSMELKMVLENLLGLMNRITKDSIRAIKNMGGEKYSIKMVN